MFTSSRAIIFCTFFLLTSVISSHAAAKVAILNVQEVLITSKAGIAARGKMEKRMKELNAALEKDKQQLVSLQNEMKKKASVWSEEKKQGKGIEFQKKRRDLRAKQDDANVEMKNLEGKKLAPIMKKLEPIVKQLAVSKGISVVLPNTAVIYFNDTVDITKEVVKKLNAAMK